MKLRTLIVALILIVIALQGLEPRFLGLSYSGASPLNTRWDGTTKLVELARGLGYEVHIVHSWLSYLLQAPKGKCSTIMLISPERSLPSIESVSLTTLVKTFGYNLVVADEGSHSTPILKSLGIDIEIDVKHMLSSIAIAEARIDNESIQLVLDYASPLNLGPRALAVCREIIVQGEKVFGVVCRTNEGTIVVIGDGTPFINAALKIGTVFNPHARFLGMLLRKLCPRGGILAIDASSYPLRTALVSELENMGFKGSSLLQVLFAPSRILKPVVYEASRSVETSIGISILICLLYTSPSPRDLSTSRMPSSA